MVVSLLNTSRSNTVGIVNVLRLKLIGELIVKIVIVCSPTLMNESLAFEPGISPELRERVLARLGLQQNPATTLAGLREVYAAWCANVPFDNVRKLIHVRSENKGPLPSYT